MTAKYISNADARRILETNHQEHFKRMAAVLGQFSRRNDSVVQPLRGCINIPGNDRGWMFLSMPAYSRDAQCIGTKLLASFPGAERDESEVNAVITLFDTNKGGLQAILEANAITEIRTAMLSAVGVHYLKDHTSMQRLAILGAGAQANGHIQVFKTLFDFETTTLWSRNYEKTKTFAEGKGVEVCRTIEDAVKEADVVVTVTNSSTPLLRSSDLKNDVLICAVGACRPDWRELHDDVMRESVIVTDSREGALEESGDVIQTGVDVFAEIGEIVNGTKTITKKPDQKIVYKTLGMAILDTVSAKLIYDTLKS